MLSSLLLLAVVAPPALTASTSPPAQITKPPVTLSLSRRLNITSARSLVLQDQARAHTFKRHGKRNQTSVKPNNDSSVTDTNQAVSYTATVGVGSPTTYYELIVDTGSSNTWVGAATPYVRTRTSKCTMNTVEVMYGSGEIMGIECFDTVDVGGGLVIPDQSIGVATISQGFSGVDGILGLGPTDLTEGTLFPSMLSLVPTLTDNLYKDGLISSKEIGVFFQPTSSQGAPDGELTWGGVNSTKMLGGLTWIPTTSTSPSNKYWGIDQSITYGNDIILNTTTGIVDTGTTLVLIATDAFQRYQTATGAVPDNTTGLLSITPARFSGLQSLFFNAGQTAFELTPNAQLWPRSLNTDIGGVAGILYLIVGDIGNPSGQGLDFINGMSFLQRFYSAFDSTTKRVGLALTPFTYAVTN